MKTKLAITLALVVAITWPPIHSQFIDRDLRTWLSGRGRMEDFELQILLGAKRWLIDIPKDKDGWYQVNTQRSVKKSGHLTIFLNTQYSGFGSL